MVFTHFFTLFGDTQSNRFELTSLTPTGVLKRIGRTDTQGGSEGVEVRGYPYCDSVRTGNIETIIFIASLTCGCRQSEGRVTPRASLFSWSGQSR
jgi:hypothetical protein